MRYEIGSLSRLGETVTVHQDRYDALLLANKYRKLSLSIEESFYSVLENYRELEESLLLLSLEYMIFSSPTWDSFQSDIHTVNRRLANFLSSVRQHLDQLDHELSFNEHVQAAYNQSRNAEYDARLGYRSMEMLRNHAQHRGLPVQVLHLSMSRDEVNAGVRVKHTITPAISISELKDDPKAKRSIIAELEARGHDEIDVKPLLREYVEGLSAVQNTVRSELAATLQPADASIDAAFDDVGKGERLIGIELRRIDDTTGVIRRESALRETVERRELLRRRLGQSAFIANHYISTEGQE